MIFPYLKNKKKNSRSEKERWEHRWGSGRARQMPLFLAKIFPSLFPKAEPKFLWLVLSVSNPLRQTLHDPYNQRLTELFAQRLKETRK